MPGTEILTVRVPAGTKDRIAAAGGAVPNAWAKDLILRALDGTDGGPRWRPLLGDRLAERVVAIEPINPGQFCRRAIEHFVIAAERERADVAARAQRRETCAHPVEKRSPIGRCKACGQAGLPSSRGQAAAKQRAKGRR